MDNQADPTEKDSHGNTVLHALVVAADNSKENTKFITSMYDHILVIAARLYPDQKLEDIQNKNGLTPLTMATKTGKSGVSVHVGPGGGSFQALRLKLNCGPAATVAP